MSIPMTKWGRDHWLTLAYIESVCVDNNGIPDLKRMQCNLNRHPGLAARNYFGDPIDGSEFTIRLADSEEITGPDYDEWDCSDDMEAAGLIHIEGTGVHRVFRMTEAGNRAVAAYRTHRTAGGNSSNFDYCR